MIVLGASIISLGELFVFKHISDISFDYRENTSEILNIYSESDKLTSTVKFIN